MLILVRSFFHIPDARFSDAFLLLHASFGEDWEFLLHPRF